jgi:hypothetical protein
MTMQLSRTTFLGLFLAFSFAFVFGTVLILNQPPLSFFGTESQGAWRSAVSTLVSPIKLLLLGPLYPVLKVLHSDPDTPPPFFIATFAFYWSILALTLHHFFRKIRH